MERAAAVKGYVGFCLGGVDDDLVLLVAKFTAFRGRLLTLCPLMLARWLRGEWRIGAGFAWASAS